MDVVETEPERAKIVITIKENGEFEFDWSKDKIHVYSVPLILKKAAIAIEKNLLGN